MGLEFEENFFLRQLFRVVNFLVYRVRRPAAVPAPSTTCKKEAQIGLKLTLYHPQHVLTLLPHSVL